MNEATIATLGDELYAALTGRKTVVPLSERHPEITVADAYRVQQRMNARRLEAGERVVGKKIGLTSAAVQKMLGVDQPDFGILTDLMRYSNGARIGLAAAGLMQPKAEGEIAFVLGRDLPADGVTRDEVLAATAYVVPCFEIVDSRIRDWKIRIQDTVADNASCGVFVLGEARADPRTLDLSAVELTIRKNGETVASGLGSAVQGHPAEAVAWLANTLGRFGIPFRKGEVILSGSLAAMVPVAAGDRLEMALTGIGGASVEFTP